MGDLDKILEWVDKNSYFESNEQYQLVVPAVGLENFINDLKNPPKKLTWQCRTVQDPEWRSIGDGDYESLQYLARFEFRQVEV